MNYFKKFIKKLFSFFLQGLLYITPVTITILVIYKLLEFFDGIIPIDIPGLGILSIVILLTIVGFLGSTFLFRPIINQFNKLLDKIPLIKIIYSSIKDFTAAFVGQKKKFTEPVLVKLSKEADVEKIGFITRKDLSDIGIGSHKVAVYFPHSYAFSGNLFIVPLENISPINAAPSEVIKFIVSGGVTQININNTKQDTLNN